MRQASNDFQLKTTSKASKRHTFSDRRMLGLTRAVQLIHQAGKCSSLVKESAG
jgi:hypothetical protein